MRAVETNNKEDKPYIVIRRTITITDRVPFDAEHYPDCATPRDAAAYERELEMSDKVENFMVTMEFVGDDELDFGEQISVDVNCPFRHAECVTSCVTPFHCKRGTVMLPSHLQ